MLVRKEWQLNQADPQEGSVLERILAIRGIHRPDDKERFLQGSLAHLHDPLRLPDMRPALERLSQARRLNEPVLIHGDYDADGLTATALLVNVLRQLGMDIHTYIPDRMTDGYGLSPSSLDFARESGCSLMVTVDCGISNRNEISQIRQLGIDVIVTDHHACRRFCPIRSPSSIHIAKTVIIHLKVWPVSESPVSWRRLSASLSRNLRCGSLISIWSRSGLSRMWFRFSMKTGSWFGWGCQP